MIGVLSNKLSESFLEKLGLSYFFISEFNPQHPIDVDGLFIDWVSKVSENEVAWMRQASLLQTYIKTGIPIVIFDREMSLTEKEVEWCKKFNVYLFEPYLNSGRSDFAYLPEWIDDTEILIGNEDRFFDVVYSHHKVEWQLKGFEKWIQEYARVFHDKNVGYSSVTVSDFKKEEFAKDNLVFQNHHLYNEGNFTVAFDTEKMYKAGYFRPMYFYAMNLGCLPLLPVEHKYFHGMFQGTIVKDMKDMDYFVSTISTKGIREIVIEEIFDRIKQEWNEFTLQHATDVIRNCYE